MIAEDRFNMAAPETRANPFPVYRKMLAEGAVHWNPVTRGWYVLRYVDVASGLRDPRISANRITPILNNLPSVIQDQVRPLFTSLQQWTLLLDPPEHTRLRKLISAAFAPRLIASMRPKIEALVAELIDGIVDNRRFDVIGDLAYPLPAVVIAEMLGVAVEDRDRLKAWSDRIAGFFGMGKMSMDVIMATQQAILAMNAYFMPIIEARRQQPQTDLISLLVNAEIDGERLTDDELLATSAMLIFGGHETTTYMIANAMLALLEHPEELAKLKANPDLIDTAIDEALRYDAPVQRITRETLDDVMLAGQTIPKGQRVFFMIGAANRDPDQFTDPDAFDISRQDNKHLAFGYGLHYCVGVSLGKLEGQIAVNAMLQRLPDLRIDSSAQALEWQDNHAFHALTALPLAFD